MRGGPNKGAKHSVDAGDCRDQKQRSKLPHDSRAFGTSVMSDGMALVVAPLAGLLFGSFASLAGHRLPRGLGVVAGLSRCRRCDATLGVRDLVPLISWALLGGRCRHCGAAIGARYPVTEAVTALGFALAVLAYGASWPAATVAALVLGLVILTIADLDHQIIPDAVLIWLLPIGLIHRVLLGAEWTDTAAGLVAAAALGIILRRVGSRLARREALGLGDVKLLAVAGAWLGLAALPGFLIAAGVLGAGFGMAWRRMRGEAAFPFGPALAAALFVCVLWAAPWTMVRG